MWAGTLTPSPNSTQRSFINVFAHFLLPVQGILSAVLLDGRPIGQQWLQCVLDINSLNAAAVAQFEACAISTAPGAEQSSKGPSIYVAKFDSPPGTAWSIGHTFWDSSGWGHGIALVNGFNLGRYWPLIGPQVCLAFTQGQIGCPSIQRTLFVPGAVLKEEDNFVVLLELIGPETVDLPVQFLAKPIIKHIQERREDQATNCCHFGLAH
jgi:beta-galactosidase